MKTLLTCCLFALSVFGQATTRSVTLTWTDTLNPTGTVYNVYRASSPCSTAPTFAAIQSGVAVMTYVDAPVPPGKYAYQVTAVSNGVESDPSACADVTVKPFPPSKPTTTVK